MAEKVPNEVIPNPDPSQVTSTAIDRAVNNSSKVINARIDGMEKAVEVFQADLTRVPTSVDRAIQGLRELIETRFDGMDKDIAGIHKSLDSRDAAVKEQTTHLRDLVFGKIAELGAVTAERFTGVAAQFSERDTRTDQRAGDTKLAVDAAFAAAKEATSKIEAGFTKSIDGQQELMNTNTKASDEKISDIKDRVTTIESRTQGIGSANQDHRENRTENWGYVIGVAFIVSALISVIGFLLHSH
jgi:hypothetical protein